MIPSEVKHVLKHNYKAKDKLFLDTNVWMFLNCSAVQQSMEDQAKVDKYSMALGRAYEASSRIFINVHVISEFINAYAKSRWRELIKEKSKGSNAISEKNFPFKKFRKSKDFEEVGKDIADSVHKRVLARCSLINDRFESLDIVNLVDEYAQGKIDFTDQIIRETCKNEGLKLITDDGDFAGQGIPLLTANQRLLN